MNKVLEKELRKIGWLIYPNDEALQIQLSRNHHIFIFKEGEGWIVWTTTYQDSQQPVKEKVRKVTRDIYLAIEDAHSYIEWYRKNVQHKEWKAPQIERLGESINDRARVSTGTC
ncbi:organic radical activating enzyme [Croceifilum oryzae]|uniref:Organic radical activating enzyme n=1 Tax=Croceifilum oryzae TaxID=1553429 RepID=A0AAJ1TK66_9BACL|nr:hypothetical protein [Croceifilum oryzae]MDQ0417574.1 organic radical activating enzyme [Croceifilum oryzae]